MEVSGDRTVANDASLTVGSEVNRLELPALAYRYRCAKRQVGSAIMWRQKLSSAVLFIARAVGSDNKRAAVDEFRLQLQI